MIYNNKGLPCHLYILGFIKYLLNLLTENKNIHCYEKSKDITKVSKIHPPESLNICTNVISVKLLSGCQTDKLTFLNSQTKKLKCAYCPVREVVIVVHGKSS